MLYVNRLLRVSILLVLSGETAECHNTNGEQEVDILKGIYETCFATDGRAYPAISLRRS